MNIRPLLVLSLLGFAVTVLKSVGKLLFYRIHLHQHTVNDNSTSYYFTKMLNFMHMNERATHQCNEVQKCVILQVAKQNRNIKGFKPLEIIFINDSKVSSFVCNKIINDILLLNVIIS